MLTATLTLVAIDELVKTRRALLGLLRVSVWSILIDSGSVRWRRSGWLWVVT